MTDEKAWKSGGDRYAQYFGDIRRHLSAEFAAEIRWITASLFALNAGGLLQIAKNDRLQLLQQFAGLAFLAGVILAFGFVTYSQHKTKQFLRIIQKIEECWVVTAATGVPGGEKLARLESEKEGIKTGLSNAFSVGSLLMFIAGIGSLALSK